MNFKNAIAVCLVSFFSATLVLLIARALDLQSAARLEPQLARIVEELQAIRRQGGGLAAPAGAAGERETADDGLCVYYFHGNVRCPTCRAIESQAHETVQSEFAAQLASGELAWKVLNYEKPEAADLGKKFQIQTPTVVLANKRNGRIADWKRLDKVWALVGDKPAFHEFIKREVSQMLQAGPAQTGLPGAGSSAATLPSGDQPAESAGLADLPAAAELPVPDDLPVPGNSPVAAESPKPQ